MNTEQWTDAALRLIDILISWPGLGLVALLLLRPHFTRLGRAIQGSLHFLLSNREGRASFFGLNVALSAPVAEALRDTLRESKDQLAAESKERVLAESAATAAPATHSTAGVERPTEAADRPAVVAAHLKAFFTQPVVLGAITRLKYPAKLTFVSDDNERIEYSARAPGNLLAAIALLAMSENRPSPESQWALEDWERGTRLFHADTGLYTAFGPVIPPGIFRFIRDEATSYE